MEMFNIETTEGEKVQRLWKCSTLKQQKGKRFKGY
jgi:hypothetical protein